MTHPYLANSSAYSWAIELVIAMPCPPELGALLLHKERSVVHLTSCSVKTLWEKADYSVGNPESWDRKGLWGRPVQGLFARWRQFYPLPRGLQEAPQAPFLLLLNVHRTLRKLTSWDHLLFRKILLCAYTKYGICWLKKYSEPKSWGLYFIQQEFLGLQASDTPSQVTLREILWGGEVGSQIIYKFCNKGPVVWMSKVIVKGKPDIPS